MINIMKISNIIYFLADDDALKSKFGTFIDDAARNLFFALDSIIYSWMSFFYKIFITIAQATETFANVDTIKEVKERIMLIIALYMLFILLFQFLQMLVDPDRLSDKEKGLGKILTRVFISFALLLSVDFIFQTAYTLQNTIIKNHVIEKVILGGETGGYFGFEERFPMDIFNSLFYPDVNFLPDDPNNFSLEEAQEKGCVLRCIQVSPSDVTANNYCIAGEEATQFDVVTAGKIFSAQYISHYSPEINQKQVKPGPVHTDNYCYVYHYGITTITGLAMCFFFITFCVDMGIRVSKLLFMQLISPIPILSYIRPGDQILMTWAKDTLSIYVDVFLRLIIINFMAVLAKVITDGINAMTINAEWEELTPGIKGFVTVFIWVGAIMFAKKAPEIIKNMFGVKGSGDLHLKGWKRALGFGAGTLVGAGVGAIGGQGIGRLNPLNALRGGVSGLKNEKMGNIASKQAARNLNARNMAGSGTSWLGRTVASAEQGVGIRSRYQKLQAQQSAVNDIKSNYDILEEGLKRRANKNNTFGYNYGGYTGTYSQVSESITAELSRTTTSGARRDTLIVEQKKLDNEMRELELTRAITSKDTEITDTLDTVNSARKRAGIQDVAAFAGAQNINASNVADINDVSSNIRSATAAINKAMPRAQANAQANAGNKT